MIPALLFRPDADTVAERDAARRHWPVFEDRRDCRDRLVIGRYSVLPFYDALEADLADRGCRLVNTFEQHRWVADFRYYPLVADLTPESWSDAGFDTAPDGPFVLKGRSSSFKHRWAERMFAADKADAARKAAELRQLPVIAQQGLLFRRYVPLAAFGTTPSGLPLADEWRFFFLNSRRLAHGFYWSRLTDARPAIGSDGIAFAEAVADRVGGRVPFLVADIARTADGRWLLIELNDGQTSGLMGIDADEFYRELWANGPL